MSNSRQEIEALQKRLIELEEREEAVFAQGYRRGYWDGYASHRHDSGEEEPPHRPGFEDSVSILGATAWQSDVTAEVERWKKDGRRTHLDGSP